MNYHARSILAIDASPFGRSLDLVPSISAMRAAFPAAYIAVAASAGICELLTSLRSVDKAINLGPIRPSDRGLGSALLRVFRLSRSIRHEEIDLVVDFSPGVGVVTLLYSLTRRARIVTAPLGRPRLTGSSRFGRASNRPVGAAAYASVLNQLDLEPDIEKWVHAPAPQESARFEEWLARSGFKGGEPVLLLYTMAAGWSRSWSVENFAQLAHRLSANYGVRVVVADAPSTTDFTSRMALSLPRDAIKLRSPRAVELIAAVARSSLAVTDDSGIARMASGLGTPAIDLGATGAAASPSTQAARDIEAVYRQACLMLQTSRTGALFR
jgi:ADP-heptose:LPS heptosyltransferase